MTLPSSLRPHCPLYLDILEAILYEHRLDTHTLAQCALVSRTMLQLSRKALYRSVSLDQSENPYAFDQQRLLRTSLAENPHLCSHIHTLRLPLSEDPLLTRVMNQLTKVERLHVIGDRPGQVSMWAEQQPYHHSSAGSSSNISSSHRALGRLLGLKSLRKVTLEGSFPFPVIDLSHFSELKDLEISSSWDLGFVAGENRRPEAAHVRDDSHSFPDNHELVGSLRAILPSRERSRQLLRLDRLSLKTKTLGHLRELFNNHDERGKESSEAHISYLRELHLDVCDPDDSDAIWGALRQCNNSLEVLSICHLWNDSQGSSFLDGALGFPNLSHLVLGVPAFSPTNNPFQPLLRLLSYHASGSSGHSRFPSLRSLKVIFDLWECEGINMPWKTISSYRGWAELDGALRLALGSDSARPSITFEIQSSVRFKECEGPGSEAEPGGLLSLLQNELPYLRRHSNFNIL